mmetsp:Transcript_28654/g.46039  ORF Transcript_28654/g.46039 Transcript_28654/m.46039 type:complete len:378 (-) Transcript_28654:174-1307(-)
MLNIGGDESDVSYRYKMPKLHAKIEGRGNGIRTIVTNMSDVAKALNCPPAYTTKFFGIELGAQSKYDSKTERASVNGAHNAPDLQKILTKYIQLFILCPRCGLPEIKWNIKRDGIKIDCAACGHNGTINTSHKLLTYILKQRAAQKGKKGKGSKKDRQLRRNQKSTANKRESNKASNQEEESVEWFTDTSQAAVEERKKAEFKKMMAGRESVSKVSSKDSPVLVLRDYVKRKEPTISGILAELKRLQVARGFSETEKFKVLLESTIDVTDPKSVPDQFVKNAKMYSQVVTNEQSGNLMLLCIEELVGVVEKKLLPRTPIILQKLYDEDVLEEEHIIKWAESPLETSLIARDTAIEVRKAAKPFVTWLQEAEEDDDDE